MFNQNLGEVIKTIKSVFPKGEHLAKIKAQRKLTTPSVITALALSNADDLESKGVYVNYKHTSDNRLVAVYVGLYGVGIIACYYTSNDE